MTTLGDITGFGGGIVSVDKGPEFYIVFNAKQLLFNGDPVDLSRASVAMSRSEVGDDRFIEVAGLVENGIIIPYKCALTIIRRSPSSVEILVDKKPAFSLGLGAYEVFLRGQKLEPNPVWEAYRIVRKSGADPKNVQLILAENSFRIAFSQSVFMSYLPVMDLGFSATPRPMTQVAHSRLQAYKIQQLGLTAVEPKTETDIRPVAWATIMLDEQEQRLFDEEDASRRQKQFDADCGCDG